MGFWGDILLLFGTFAASSSVVTYVMYKGFQAVSKTINQNLDNIDTNKGISGISTTNYMSDPKKIPIMYNYMDYEASDKFDAFRSQQKSVENLKNDRPVQKRTAILEKTQTMPQRSDRGAIVSSPAQKPSQNNSPVFYAYSEKQLKEKARKDALTGDYTVLHSQSENNQKLYNGFYKEFRKKSVRVMAQDDAFNRHKYNLGEKKVQPVLQGRKLTVPAEVSIYQNLFVKEMSKLEEEHRKLLIKKKELLKELYEEEEFPAPMDPEVFYKTF